METELYQLLVFAIMTLLCISNYYRGYWIGRADEHDDGGWMNEACWWRKRHREREEKYVSVFREPTQ